MIFERKAIKLILSSVGFSFKVRAYFTLHDIHEGADLRSERCNVSRWFPDIYYIENINSREEDCDGLRTWFIQPNVATARAGSDKEVHLLCNGKYSASPVRFVRRSKSDINFETVILIW